jgi:hypothetical protein
MLTTRRPKPLELGMKTMMCYLFNDVVSTTQITVPLNETLRLSAGDTASFFKVEEFPALIMIAKYFSYRFIFRIY